MVLVNLSQTPSQQIEFNFFGFVSFFRQLSPLFIIRIGLISHTSRWTTFWGEDQRTHGLEQKLRDLEI